jgi:hypothetical protein
MDVLERVLEPTNHPSAPTTPKYDINPFAKTATEKRFDQRSEQAKDLCLSLYRLQLIMINYLRSQGEYIHS